MASLFDAASCGSIAATRRLLEARADVNQRKTVMRAASSCNARAPASACAWQVFSLGRVASRSRACRKPQSPPLMACSCCPLRLDWQDGRTALHMAALAGHATVVASLIMRRADIWATAKVGPWLRMSPH